MCSAGPSTAPQPQAMGRKNDLVIWLSLKPVQRRIYEVKCCVCLP